MVHKRSFKRVRMNNYTVVSICGNEEFFQGSYGTYKEAYRKARFVDSYLTSVERKHGYRTEVWTNYNPENGDVQTIHRIAPKR